MPIPPGHVRWYSEWQNLIGRLRASLRRTTESIGELKRLIHDWRLRPLQPAEEQERAAREKNVVSKAERQAARDKRRQESVVSLQKRIDSLVSKLHKEYLKARKNNAIGALWPVEVFDNPIYKLFGLFTDGVRTLMGKVSFSDKAEAINALDRPELVLALGLARSDGTLVLDGRQFPDPTDRSVLRLAVEGMKNYFMGR
jgi:hypothetical protein